MPDPYSMQNRAQMADMSPESLVFRGGAGAGPRMPMPPNPEVHFFLIISLITYFIFCIFYDNNQYITRHV